jgi:cytoskeletal protein RodZ
VVLGIGITLLAVTFASALIFLVNALPIFASESLAQTFGETLAPLVATSIRVMYLGIMGWVGSLITIRGVTIIANSPKVEANEPQKPQEAKMKKPEPTTKPVEKQEEPQKEQQLTKTNEKQAEPDIVIIPPEEIEQQSQHAQP